MSLSINDSVKVQTFFGTNSAEEVIDDAENYWKLIGYIGNVVKVRATPHPAFPERGCQVLVQFKQDVKDLHLHFHNEIENSIWLFPSDLIKIK